MSSQHHMGEIHQTCVLKKNLYKCKKMGLIGLLFQKRVPFSTLHVYFEDK